MALVNLRLLAEVKSLIASFKGKGKEFNAILKMGRTQLQDAVPMTLGQEFAAFAETLAGEVRALEAVQRVLCEVNMGATAIGTGLNAPVGYANKCTEHLAAISGLPIYIAEDLIEANMRRVAWCACARRESQWDASAATSSSTTTSAGSSRRWS